MNHKILKAFILGTVELPSCFPFEGVRLYGNYPDSTPRIFRFQWRQRSISYRLVAIKAVSYRQITSLKAFPYKPKSLPLLLKSCHCLRLNLISTKGCPIKINIILRDSERPLPCKLISSSFSFLGIPTG